MKSFPVGGPRQPVYNFLQMRGWIMSNHSDKEWNRADGAQLHLYGAGSMARIYNKDGALLSEGVLSSVLSGLRS